MSVPKRSRPYLDGGLLDGGVLRVPKERVERDEEDPDCCKICHKDARGKNEILKADLFGVI